MRHQLRLFTVALQFLTRLPTPALANFQADWLHQSSRYFPAVGLLLGAICGAAFWLISLWFTPWVAAVLSTALGVYITGAFHEDGWADSCDGLGGSYEKTRALEIMKDSRLGSFGVLGLILMLGLKISLLASFSAGQGFLALIFAHTASRLACISLIVVLPYGGDIEHAKAKPMAQQMSRFEWGMAALWLLLPAGLLGQAFGLSALLLALGLGALATVLMGRKLKQRLAGYTGDGLGATQQLSEVALYLGLVASLA